jgi:hypothetical protein
MDKFIIIYQKNIEEKLLILKNILSQRKQEILIEYYNKLVSNYKITVRIIYKTTGYRECIPSKIKKVKNTYLGKLKNLFHDLESIYIKTL